MDCRQSSSWRMYSAWAVLLVLDLTFDGMILTFQAARLVGEIYYLR